MELRCILLVQRMVMTHKCLIRKTLCCCTYQNSQHSEGLWQADGHPFMSTQKLLLQLAGMRVSSKFH